MRTKPPNLIEVPLESPLRSWTFLILVATMTALLGYKAFCIAFAEETAKTTSLPGLQRALALDPKNPEYIHRLGLYYVYGIEMPPQTGIDYLRKAAEMRSDDYRYWLGLGAACESQGDGRCADLAYTRALGSAPMVPRNWWYAANHELRAGRDEDALRYFRRLLEMSPDYGPQVFHLCLRVGYDPLALFKRAVQPCEDPSLTASYIVYLSERGDLVSALELWREAVRSRPKFAFSSVAPFLQRLLSHGQYREAQGVWLDLEKLNVIQPAPQGEEPNLVYNGDFARAPLNAGFDWQFGSTGFLSLDFADPSAFRSQRCARIDFAVPRNEEYWPLSQFVAVSSNQRYRLSAFVRSDSITSESGPRLRVDDLNCPGCSVWVSQSTAGTSAWHVLELEFNTSPNTEAVRVSVWRPRARTFPMEISGSFWIDAVELKTLRTTTDAAQSLSFH